MFCGCISLYSFEGFEKINATNIKRFGHLFSFSNISSISDISNWDTKNVTFMDNIFYYCFNLKYNTSKLKNIGQLFGSCCSLESLPDISKLDTCNLDNISGLFQGCESLKKIPDISK